ncbi:protein of unknown function [Catalinimonas alkaloidigena]|uniref:DUF4412 domain-containing protein n=1 Tax=Catalinimonas alkaloidigena TaxID=1075417 RepID=A0A1G9PP96_9BACT|nr:DUF4412 domain-containing protein [Catalinimonas alkaloidigena]SDM00600.1 protein of unknown function [Catalinimonas alkaloidigena]
MKLIRYGFLLLLIGLVSFAHAQDFEGRINYSIKVSGSNAQQLAAMMPKSYDLQMKEGKVRMKSDAAMMNDVLMLNDERVSYLMLPSQKKAFRIKMQDQNDQQENVSVEKTDETRSIAGYNCKKYVVSVKDPQSGVTQKQTIWATPALQLSKMQGSTGGMNIFYKDIDGTPLAITMETPMFSMEMTATNVSKESVPDAVFTVPSEYKVEDFDPAMLQGMGR